MNGCIIEMLTGALQALSPLNTFLFAVLDRTIRPSMLEFQHQGVLVKPAGIHNLV